MTNPRSAVKMKVLHSFSAITASENGAAVDARGMENVKFALQVTSHDRTTGDETLDAKIQGRHNSDDTWSDIDGCAFTQIAATSGSEQKPADSDAPGVVLPRYLRVVLTLAGTTPISTGRVVAYYERPRIGHQVAFGNQTG